MSIPMIDPIAEYQAWLDKGGLVDPQVLRSIYKVIRADTEGRSDAEGIFRASLLGDPCDRKQVLSFIGDDQSTTNIKYAVAGSWSHLRWQAAGRSAGWLKRIEVPAKHGTWFRGHADGLMIDGRVFELKTTRSNLIKKLECPKEEHLDQVAMLVYALKARGACIVYEGREGLELKKFDVRPDHKRVMRIINRVLPLRKGALEGQVPDMHPDCKPGTVMREYCSFRDSCIIRFVDQQQATDDAGAAV